jgi:hypothetical protein
VCLTLGKARWAKREAEPPLAKAAILLTKSPQQQQQIAPVENPLFWVVGSDRDQPIELPPRVAHETTQQIYVAAVQSLPMGPARDKPNASGKVLSQHIRNTLGGVTIAIRRYTASHGLVSGSII